MVGTHDALELVLPEQRLHFDSSIMTDEVAEHFNCLRDDATVLQQVTGHGGALQFAKAGQTPDTHERRMSYYI